MENRTIVILSTLMLVTSFAFGRWTSPEKVKIETRTVEVEKKTDQLQTDTNRNRRTEVTETQITRPDGTTEKTKKTIQTAETHKETDHSASTDSSTLKEESKEVTRSTGRTTVSALIGVQLRGLTAASPLLYGAQVYRPVLGPIGIGIWGFTDLSFGVSLGISL